MDDTAETSNRSGGGFSDERADNLRQRSAQAESELEQREVALEAINVVADLGHAMQTRSTIDLAKGIIMATTGCDEQAAFDHLVKRSQRNHVKLHVVAQDLINSHRKSVRPEDVPG